MDSGTGAGSPDPHDLTMLRAVHDAFRRDAGRLASAAPRDGGGPVVRRSWAAFKRHLALQHALEEAMLWSALRAGPAGRPAALAEMERRHVGLVARIDAVDAALAYGDRARLAENARAFSAGLNAHLDHREVAVFPLLHAALTADEWDAFEIEGRRRRGAKGLAAFLPWVLDGVPEAERQAVLDLLPTPVRVACRIAWLPRYARRPHWAPPGA